MFRHLNLSPIHHSISLIATSSLIWATVGLWEKRLLQFLSPVTLAFGTLLFAIITLFTVGRVSPRRLFIIFRARPFLYIALGLTGFAVSYPMTYYALAHLPLGVVIPLIKLQVVFVLILSPFFLQEKITKLQIILILLALVCGILTAVPLSDLIKWEINNNIAVLTGLGSALSFSFASILGKTALKHQTKPVHVTLLRFITGFIFLLPIIIFENLWQEFSSLPPAEWGLLLLLGILSEALGILLYYKAMRSIKLAFVTVFEMLQTLFAVLLGFLFLNEVLQWSQYLAIAGLLITVATLAFQEDRTTKLAETHNLP